MFLVKKFLSALVLPPFGLLLALIVGLALLKCPRTRAAGRVLTGLALVLLVSLSLPIVGATLLRTLETHPPIALDALREAQAIVVLAGGVRRWAPEYGRPTVNAFTLERLRYAARLQRASRLPVLVTGGAPFGGPPEGVAMAHALQEDFAVPVRWIESASRDTGENASMSAAILRHAGVTRIALISHSWHLPRAVELFERQGFTVLPAPTVFTGRPEVDVENLLPSMAALERSHVALHEWLGILVQKLHR